MDLPKDLREKSLARQLATDRYERELQRRTQRLQKDIFSDVAVMLAEHLDTSKDDYSILSKINTLERAILPKTQSFYRRIAEDLVSQGPLVYDYYTTLLGKQISGLRTSIRDSILKRIGYQGKTKGLKSGGLFDQYARDLSKLDKVRAATTKAIASGMGMDQFMKQLRVEFGQSRLDDRLGFIDHKVRNVVYDTYQQNDAYIVTKSAKDLGIEYYVYQGGLVESSRSFCVARNNKVFTSKEIESWKNLQFQGKPKVYDPFIDRGGYNCRHQLDPISEDLYNDFKEEESGSI